MKLLMITLLFNVSLLQAETHHVDMIGHKFVPNSISIKPKDIIIWTNKTKLLHNVVIDGMNAGWVKPGGALEIIFDNPNKREYFCTPHKAMWMTGEIIIE